MAMMILLVALAIEVAFTAFCVTTRSRQKTIRGIIRILAFAAFVSLILTGIIRWDFRWVGIATLLLVWALYDVWILTNANFSTDGYRAGSVVRQALTRLLLLVVALTPALLFPGYEPLAATGPFPVAAVRTTFIDTQRVDPFTESGEYRRVNVAFWVPQAAGGEETYPLVLFSHGGLGTLDSNESLYRELASHGYVVCAIGHPYHAFWTESDDGRMAFVNWDYFQEFLREDAGRDREESFRYYRKWMETRTGDINFVIDTILEKTSAGAPGVYELINGEMIGVMGHSLGGSAALALPRQRDDIDAVIALESPLLYDIVGVEQGEFVWTDSPYPAPVLNIYSDSSWGHLSEWPQYAGNFALLSNPSESTPSQYLSGAGHFSLTDLSLTSPLLVYLLEGGGSVESSDYLRIVNRVCLAFLDRYLKGQSNSTSDNADPALNSIR